MGYYFEMATETLKMSYQEIMENSIRNIYEKMRELIPKEKSDIFADELSWL
ncbi:MAG: hypothetical protein RR355_01770 [Oscillospiraceae bacterium]